MALLFELRGVVCIYFVFVSFGFLFYCFFFIILSFNIFLCILCVENVF